MKHQVAEHADTAFAGIIVPLVQSYELLLPHQAQQADHHFGTEHPVQFLGQRSNIGTGFPPFQFDVQNAYGHLFQHFLKSTEIIIPAVGIYPSVPSLFLIKKARSLLYQRRRKRAIHQFGDQGIFGQKSHLVGPAEIDGTNGKLNRIRLYLIRKEITQAVQLVADLEIGYKLIIRQQTFRMFQPAIYPIAMNQYDTIIVGGTIPFADAVQKGDILGSKHRKQMKQDVV